MANETVKRRYLPNLDFFRVIAAYFVMLYHFSWEGDDAFSTVFSYGYLGVYVFFCISGFITPLSMQWSGYKMKSWKSFLVSRFFRLYPAFAVIALIEILLYARGGFMGYGYKLDELTVRQLICNFMWTAEFYEERWIIPVFWTLAIEAQFIILMLIVYPLMKLSNKIKKELPSMINELLRMLPVLIFIGASYFTGRGNTVFSYGAIFGMGTLVYLYYAQQISIPSLLGGLAFAAWANYYGISDRQTYVALPVALCIAFLPDINSRIIKYFGKFTYSFYLIHITFGGAACFHMRHFPEVWYVQLVKVVIGGAVAFAFSWVFYYKIEKPLHNFSRKFK